MPVPALGLIHVAIPAPNMAASIAFYECLGATKGFCRRDAAGRIALIQLHLGTGFVELLADAPAPGGGHLAFSTSDIEAVWTLLAENGYPPLAVPARGESGVKWFFVHDPAGNSVEITMPDPQP